MKKDFWTEYYDDLDRLAENIIHKYPDIYDKDSFNESFDDYLKDKDIPNSPKEKLRKGAWEHVFKTKGISPMRKREIKKTSSVTIEEKTKIRNKRIKELNLPFSVAKKKGKKTVQYNYDILGYQKSKTVYARSVKTKKGIRFIDRKGRYVSLKRKK